MKRKRSRLIDLGQVLEYAFELLTFHEVIQCRLVNQRCNENWEQYMKVQLHRIDLSKFHDKRYDTFSTRCKHSCIYKRDRISQLLVQHSSPLYHVKFGNRLPNLEVFRQLMTPNLVSLDFINSRCVLDVYIRIIAATCHQLKSFRLGSNSNNDGVRELIKMNHQTLQILDFADSSMIDNIEMCSQLHSLSFRAPIQGRFENAVINFRAFDLITELDLAGQDWRYGKELKSCAHLRLQRLNISRLAVAEEDMDTLIIEMHRTGNNWRNMVDLDMSNIRNISTTEYFGLSDTTLLRFLSLFTCLKRLDVSNHEVRQENANMVL